MSASAKLFRINAERAILAAVFCSLTGAGVALWRAESAAMAAVAGVAPHLRLLASPDPLALGYGQRSVAQSIAGCFAGLDAITGFYPADARLQAAEVCRQTAEAILQDAPTHGAARQLLAEAYFRLGLVTAAATALNEAAQLAPNTTWLLQRRLLLLSRFDPTTRAAALANAEPLVSKLISEPRSREWLAQAFVREPSMRALVEAGAATLPAPQAAQFLARVKALGAAADRGQVSR